MWFILYCVRKCTSCVINPNYLVCVLDYFASPVCIMITTFCITLYCSIMFCIIILCNTIFCIIIICNTTSCIITVFVSTFCITLIVFYTIKIIYCITKTIYCIIVLLKPMLCFIKFCIMYCKREERENKRKETNRLKTRTNQNAKEKIEMWIQT